MIFFKWNACHYKQDILNQIDLIRPRTGNILVINNELKFISSEKLSGREKSGRRTPREELLPFPIKVLGEELSGEKFSRRGTLRRRIIRLDK
jgi:hypothetical protein